MTRAIKRGGKVWIKIFPHKPVTKKPLEVRMGGGKGGVEFYAASVKVLLDTAPPPQRVELKNVPSPQVVEVPKTVGGFYTLQTESGEEIERVVMSPSVRPLIGQNYPALSTQLALRHPAGLLTSRVAGFTCAFPVSQWPLTRARRLQLRGQRRPCWWAHRLPSWLRTTGPKNHGAATMGEGPSGVNNDISKSLCL
jgi:hypothetical protein